LVTLDAFNCDRDEEFCIDKNKLFLAPKCFVWWCYFDKTLYIMAEEVSFVTQDKKEKLANYWNAYFSENDRDFFIHYDKCRHILLKHCNRKL
jgi:hypothetical protein